eukprot:6191158-Pleurochrysis_carterae.AAC.4
MRPIAMCASRASRLIVESFGPMRVAPLGTHTRGARIDVRAHPEGERQRGRRLAVELMLRHEAREQLLHRVVRHPQVARATFAPIRFRLVKLDFTKRRQVAAAAGIGVGARARLQHAQHLHGERDHLGVALGRGECDGGEVVANEMATDTGARRLPPPKGTGAAWLLQTCSGRSTTVWCVNEARAVGIPSSRRS